MTPWLGARVKEAVESMGRGLGVQLGAVKVLQFRPIIH